MIKSHGARDLNILNWPLNPVSGNGFNSGISLLTEYNTKKPNKPINKNVIRQEKLWLKKVPKGIPIRFATVIPETIIATAWVAFPLSASLSATIAPTPKKHREANLR